MNKTFVDKIADFLEKIVDRSGTKFLIAASVIFSLWDLAKTDQLDIQSGILIVCGGLIFYLFKFLEEKFGLNGNNKIEKGDKG